MTKINIEPGLQFRECIGDENVLFEVKSRVGRGAWRCVGVNEPYEVNGKTYPSDYAGEVRLFTTKQITAVVAYERHCAASRKAHDDFYASLTIGQTVHYYNMPTSIVRCVVVEKDGAKVLKPVALLGEWHANDLMHSSYKDEGKTFTPNYSWILESPAFAYKERALALAAAPVVWP